MTDPITVTAIRNAVAAMNEGDVDGYLAGFAPTCPRYLAGHPQPLSLSDVADGLRQMNAAFEPLHLGEDGIFGTDEFVCARWRLRGKHVRDFMGIAASGVQIEMQYAEIYQFDEGRFVAVWVYGDHADLFRQITSAPADGATP